jgi:hypothetical protein
MSQWAFAVKSEVAPEELRLRNRVQLEIAELKEATRVIVKNHYLHRGRTMAQLPYWILVDGKRRGVLLFSYPRMSVPFLGYGPMNLLELARLWLDSSVQGMRVLDSKGREHSFSVATCAVGRSLRRVRADWHGKYPHLPDLLAVVSWADLEHHEGTIYRAANFREVGVGGGTLHGNTYRRNGGHDQLNADYLHTKRAFLYEFRRAFTDADKARARLEWARLPRSLQRVSANKLAKVERRVPAQPYAMRFDVAPPYLRIVQSEPPVANLPQPR